MRHGAQHVMPSLTRLLAVGATLLLSALPAEPASFAYAGSGATLEVINTANPSIVARIPTGLGFGGGGPVVDPSETHVYMPNFGHCSRETGFCVDMRGHFGVYGRFQHGCKEDPDMPGPGV